MDNFVIGKIIITALVAVFGILAAMFFAVYMKFKNKFKPKPIVPVKPTAVVEKKFEFTPSGELDEDGFDKAWPFP